MCFGVFPIVKSGIVIRPHNRDDYVVFKNGLTCPNQANCDELGCLKVKNPLVRALATEN
jgi:hypothetical protein